MKDVFKPDNDKFKPGDLVRVKHEQPSTVQFARVFRVHQAYIQTVEALDPHAGGKFTSPHKWTLELVNRPSENDEDFGFVALPESQLEVLWHLAVEAGEPSAEALADELERIRTTWPTEDEDCD